MGGPRSTKARMMPPGRASSTACCNAAQCIAGLPLRLERQSAQGQDLDLEADAEGALGDLMQRIQDVKRRLHIRVRASCQQDLGLRQVRVLQPGQQPIRRRSCVRICPAKGGFSVPLPIRQLRAQ